jgi:anti-sigma B factor antagonist
MYDLMLELEIVRNEEKHLEIEVGGQLLYSEAEKFKDTILPYLKEQNKVTIDCKRLDFIDSAGMGSFVRLWKECKIIGADLEFQNVVDHVQNLLKIARLHQLTSISSQTG